MERRTLDASSGFGYETTDVASSDEVDAVLRQLDEPSLAPAANLHRRARVNIRRHFTRAAIRVSVLLVADLATYEAARVALHALRRSETLSTVGRDGLNRLLVEGYLGGPQFACALILGLAVMGCYRAGDNRRDGRRIFLACALATALSLWSVLWTGSPIATLTRFAITAIVFGCFLLTERLILDFLVGRYYPRPGSARTLLIGPGASCSEMLRVGACGERTAFNVLGFVDTDTPALPEAKGHLGRLDAILHDDRVDTIVLCGQVSERRFSRIVRAAMAAECHVLAESRAFAVSGVQPSIVWHRGVPLLELRAPVLRGQQLVAKRTLDIALSLLAIFLLSPLLLLVAVLIRLDSRGPVFFAQRRLGRHGQMFRCLKFRSMYVDAEERLKADPDLYQLYIANDYKLPEEIDTRITPVGRFLRRSSLDELPQLYNVLRGDMSLVGPRPIVPDEIRHYYHDGSLFLSLKPGLTGAWQVYGRSSIPYPERARLELEYVQSWSLARDIEIMLRTIPAVVFQRGAH